MTIKPIEMSDGSHYCQANCHECGTYFNSLYGIEVYQNAKAHLRRHHGGGWIIAKHFRQEIKP